MPSSLAQSLNSLNERPATCRILECAPPSVAVWVSGIQGCQHLAVIAARLAVAMELDALDLDLVGLGFSFQQMDNLVDELVEWRPVSKDQC